VRGASFRGSFQSRRASGDFSSNWLVDAKIDCVCAQLSDKKETNQQALWDRPPGRERTVEVRRSQVRERIQKLEVRRCPNRN
jgi:hypothetical protein